MRTEIQHQPIDAYEWANKMQHIRHEQWWHKKRQEVAKEHLHYEAESSEAISPEDRRASRALTAGAIGSVVLAATVEYRAGLSKDMLGLASNAFHNFGDGLIHGLRAYALARPASGNTSRARRTTAAAMGVTTAASVAHTGEHALDLYNDPDSVFSAGSALLSKEALGSLAGNVGIAYGLGRLTRNTELHGEVVEHGKNDAREAALNVLSTVNPALELAGGVAVSRWSARLTRKMWRNANSSEHIHCDHVHGNDHHHEHNEHHHERSHDHTEEADSFATGALQKVTNAKRSFSSWMTANATRLAMEASNHVRSIQERMPKHSSKLLASLGGAALACVGAYATIKYGDAQPMELGSEPLEASAPLVNTLPDWISEFSALEAPAEDIPNVIHLDTYNASTGDGTVWNIAEEQLAQLGYSKFSNGQIYTLTEALLEVNDMSWQDATRLQPGTTIRLIDATDIQKLLQT